MLPAGYFRSCDLNSMIEQDCVCVECGEFMLSQRAIGDRHRRDVHLSLDVDWPLFLPIPDQVPPKTL